MEWPGIGCRCMNLMLQKLVNDVERKKSRLLSNVNPIAGDRIHNGCKGVVMTLF